MIRDLHAQEKLSVLPLLFVVALLAWIGGCELMPKNSRPGTNHHSPPPPPKPPVGKTNLHSPNFNLCLGALGLPGAPMIPITSGEGSLRNVAAGDLDGDGDLDLVGSGDDINGSTYYGFLSLKRNNGDGTFSAMGGTSGRVEDTLSLADMNNDGFLDIVQLGLAGTSNPLFAEMRLNDGTGKFTSVPYKGFASGYGSERKMVIVDVNNDGFRDILAQIGANYSLHVVFNNGGTSIDAPTALNISGFVDFDAADINGDGLIDVVLGINSNNLVGVRFGTGNGVFGPQNDYPGPTGINAVKLGDLDGDGKLDLVAGNGTSTHVWKNLGNGTFAAPTTYTGGSAKLAHLNGDGFPDIVGSTVLINQGNGSFTSNMVDYMPHERAAVGDINGDGLDDFARIDGEGIGVFYNRGNALFDRPFVKYSLGSEPHQMVAADLNGDNLEDLALVGSASNTVDVWINTGNGVYAPPADYATSANSRSVVAADMDGDNDLDLVTSGTEVVSVLLNKGAGTFASAVDYAVSQAGFSLLVSADYNGDGYPDVARLTKIGAGETALLTVMFNQGDGTLDAGFVVPTSDVRLTDLATADVNGDGYADILVRWSLSTFDVLLNDGTGGFGPPIANMNFVIDSGPYFVVADFNYDTFPDVALAGASSASSSHVVIYYNKGDGTFDVGSSILWNDASGAFVSAADLDGNNFTDLLVNKYPKTLSVYLNYGNGNFGPELRYQTSGWATTITDVDGDGISELLASNGALHRITCTP